MQKSTRRLWAKVGWTAAVLLTVGTGFVVGYGAIWFQLFGATADREDYLVSAGGYGAAAVVLLLAVPALLAYRGPRSLVVLAGGVAVVYVLLAYSSVATSTEAEDRGGLSTWLDGAGGVLATPWTWPLVVLGLIGTVRLLRRSVTPVP